MRAQARIAQDWLYYFGGLADKIEGTVIPLDRQSIFNYTLREPLGVVGVITPWNSPTFIAIMSLAPALAAGNTIVLKPSEITSASAVELARLAELAGIPAGRDQRRLRLSRDRRGAGRSSARRQGLVHRQRRRRPIDCRARRTAPGQLHARARRQESEHRVRRCQPGSGGGGGAGGHLRGGGADLRRRFARLHPRVDLRRVRRSHREARAADHDRRPAEGRDSDGSGRDQDAARKGRVDGAARRQRRREGAVRRRAAGDRRVSGGLLLPADHRASAERRTTS